MATLIAVKDFRLNLGGEIIKFRQGDIIEGKAAEHWYAKAHAKPADDKSAGEIAKVVEEAQKAEEETKATKGKK